MSLRIKKEGKAPKRKIEEQFEEVEDDYHVKRQRNNIAVRKSREKSRAKAQETQERVRLLKKENADLEMKVTLLSKELHLLKDLFLSHARGVKAEKCPEILADVVPAGKEEQQILEKEEDSMYGSPVNQEGLENDHEYFGRKACVC
ncbi:hypothetical protein CAPTEDRAFT_179985 [Capitella teleta]|uniref:BZIP domain-containing protein n=1 Tax=Capitella teleta TaxID=283909 RepID=R7V8A4_CAPTE|nr:hypothetical protein CAPTEDRAFT_179985 [Capitella teleta]|eukprot:ELU14769.1 hypothetical protein CAPTEDRAFT_179985 [Capitella teleta]